MVKILSEELRKEKYYIRQFRLLIYFKELNCSYLSYITPKEGTKNAKQSHNFSLGDGGLFMC